MRDSSVDMQWSDEKSLRVICALLIREHRIVE